MMSVTSRLMPSAAVFTFGLALVAGCGTGTSTPSAPQGDVSNRHSVGTKETESARDTPKDLAPARSPGGPANGKEPLPVTAVALTKEFETAFDDATKKYAEQSLVVEGVVDDPNLKGADGRARVTLDGFKAPYFVDCWLTPTPQAVVSKLSKGQKVKVVGKFAKASKLYITLTDCKVVEFGPDAVVSISAAQLTEEFSKDREATNEKYADKTLVVEGVVVQVEFEPGKGKRSAYLEGNDEKADKPVRVIAEFHIESQEELSSLKVGQKVKVKGLYRGDLFGSVFLSKVIPVK
jgi:hypothetical protein